MTTSSWVKEALAFGFSFSFVNQQLLECLCTVLLMVEYCCLVGSIPLWLPADYYFFMIIKWFGYVSLLLSFWFLGLERLLLFLSFFCLHSKFF